MPNIGVRVANALHWDFAVPRHSVTAEVEGGFVTLHGIVERAYEKSSAEATVLRVPGVIGVKNEIAVHSRERSARQPFIGDAARD